ncbi:D-cysteine desulfhydrase [Chengkuizengella axinellae]|uniref:D-cysteine desulfhydrase n=1 Tax=Chengkuizengella axinellae TaxID=3064388 RepID=A0ABT9IYD1_9BACL|nr:D-cysteine desulfhydrase [Chengkuizengella sp. 2205SS18-9]MDP5274157.1 D-cysteine desulfhydrase [Chengkuizengella sp. 2205SS18-9]
MNLQEFPRQIYTEFKTPIQPLCHLSKRLGGPNIYVKRDDLLGLTGGGNKTRKLEFLVADALKQGADTLITTGAVQSNHCRLTLAAAVKEGLRCRLLLEERNRKYNPNANGNHFLFELMDVEQLKVVPDGTDVVKEMEAMKQELELEGRNGYIVAEGGGNDIGAMGYMNCSYEILEQSDEMDLKFDHIVTASGSGGTHAGLVAGIHTSKADVSITGINVRRSKLQQEEKVYGIIKNLSNRLILQDIIPRKTVQCFDDYIGPGYALPSEETINAIQLLAQTEGILLDPVYTGKVMAGLIGLVKKGYFSKEDKVLFIHTGGTPAIYEYASTILNKENNPK